MRKRLSWVLILVFVATSGAATPVRLDIPLVRQPEGRLCGPAGIEMVFRFWGDSQRDQYAIAREIAATFAGEWIKAQLERGLPVSTPHFWRGKDSSGRYRVITGYDDEAGELSLNDAELGRIRQSNDELEVKGAFPGTWMPYDSLAFKTNEGHIARRQGVLDASHPATYAHRGPFFLVDWLPSKLLFSTGAPLVASSPAAQSDCGHANDG